MLKREVKITAIQPPAYIDKIKNNDTVGKGLELLEKAGEMSTDIACLPEYFNVCGLSDEEARKRVGIKPDIIFKKVVEISKKYKMSTILPVMQKRQERFYNTTLVINKKGKVMGRYDKTHLTRSEREKKIASGNTYPVFGMDFGKIGIMICYDIYFPEVARILALNGAEIIFFPSFQRHITEDRCEFQIRARAYENCLYIVRSSYGYYPNKTWMPGMMIGKSCIVNYEGIILADAGIDVGMVTKIINLDEIRNRETSFEGEIDNPQKYLFKDRRAETYKDISKL